MAESNIFGIDVNGINDGKTSFAKNHKSIVDLAENKGQA